jgi:hypothetical protein
MSRIIAILLAAALVVTATVSYTAASSHTPQTSPASTTANNHPAGCHDHDDAPLASHPDRLPVPVDYQCCITGHDAAVLHASDLPWPVIECAHFVVQSDLCASPSFSQHFEAVLPLSADPPLLSPLRI